MGISIVTITGPSGAGKTTIVRELLERHPEWKMVISLTSRKPRGSDLPGEYRCNVPMREFYVREMEDEFIWRVDIHGNVMATLFSDVDKALAPGSLSFMQIIPNAVKKIRAYAPGRVLSVFILPPSEKELRRRLENRGEPPESIEKRIIDCRKWEKEARLSDIPYEFVKNDGPIAESSGQAERIIKNYI